MIWLILSIISATGIFVTFKFIDKTRTPLINAIVINYLIATIFGFILTGSFPVKEIINSEWIYFGMMVGVLLIVMFFVVGQSSKVIGISITTVVSKMAVVIPMIFAIIAYNENINAVKIISIILAVIAVSISVYKKPQKKTKLNAPAVILPVVLFVGMGLDNSLLIFSKENYVDASMSSLFSATIFSFALISGIIITLVKPSVFRGFFNLKTWFLGSVLGIANFGSIYFMLRTLNSGVFANSVAFGIVDIGIVFLSVLTGTMFFKEKLTKLNIAGVVLSIATIVLLTFAGL